ncbi:hypothetical protein GCM10010970_23170 [Silvimonas iriomotensis]|uniref:Uncharacterized protein n=1 Tax=Silvimonas iriomotensis TaxID=449662 RepID=A0ABQ2P9X1_9NEIS|nr:hypothetical protein GCM10010970_23170 [Silvimonas iriomotensis]
MLKLPRRQTHDFLGHDRAEGIYQFRPNQTFFLDAEEYAVKAFIRNLRAIEPLNTLSRQKNPLNQAITCTQQLVYAPTPVGTPLKTELS